MAQCDIMGKPGNKRRGVSGFAMGVFALAMLLPNHSAHAELDSALESGGWEEIIFDKKTPNTYTPLPGSDDAGNTMALTVTSESSVSVAYRDFAVDIDAKPYLEWQWRSENPDPDTDTTKKGGDDRTLSVYVAFPWQPEYATLFERIQRKFVETMRGEKTPGRIITYIWGGGAPMDERFPNPYAGSYGYMIIKATPQTPLGVWHDVRVNLREDFMEAFGYPPGDPVFVGVGSDSDDTKTTIVASVRGLRFVGE